MQAKILARELKHLNPYKSHWGEIRLALWQSLAGSPIGSGRITEGDIHPIW